MAKQDRRSFIKSAIAMGAASSLPLSAISNDAPLNTDDSHALRPKTPPEWRNKKDGMRYRCLGNTGLMVSEMVLGTFGPGLVHVGREAIEQGVNYFDTAQRYGAGKNEGSVGSIVQDTSLRERVFLSTKISAYLPKIDSLAQETIKGLPGDKLRLIEKQAQDALHRSGVGRPGYHYSYFKWHYQELPKAYLTREIVRQYGQHGDFRKQVLSTMQDALDGSLRRLQTDYIDILHCPHGARTPEELEDETIAAFFESAKKSGKIRFAGVSVHSDVPRILSKAAILPQYDVAMAAYNIANQGTMELPIIEAANHGLGVIAMKVARAINREIAGEPVPEWRRKKLDETIEGDEKPELKAYRWGLINPNIAAVISQVDSTEMLLENLAVCKA